MASAMAIFARQRGRTKNVTAPSAATNAMATILRSHGWGKSNHSAPKAQAAPAIRTTHTTAAASNRAARPGCHPLFDSSMAVMLDAFPVCPQPHFPMPIFACAYGPGC
jgi:hypothetical protein